MCSAPVQASELRLTRAPAELQMLRIRLTEARLHKAPRRELRQLLPVGLAYDDDGERRAGCR